MAVCLHAASAWAQGQAMALADVLARARARAPEIVSARGALDETRGRLVGASVRSQTNPDIEVLGGRRTGSGGGYTDIEFGVTHTLEPGGRRAARVAGATAAVEQAAADVDAVTRNVLREAASAYYRVIHAQERLALLDAAQVLSSRIYTTTERRFQAGDIAVLDVNIARASLARVKADHEAAEATRALAIGELRRLLGTPDDVTVTGSLDVGAPVDLAGALQSAEGRPELRGLQAALREAEADQRFGLSLTKPQFGVGARYSHEEGDQVVLGGLTITLPLFAKGQGERAVATARRARLLAELEAARTRVRIDVRTAFDAWTRRAAAVRVLEAEATPSLDENEQLTTRSFEVGQIGLPDLLLIRREMFDIRVQYLDALLEAALARVELDASAAILR